MSGKSGEHELTDDDRRILKYVADAAREEMPTRRDALKMGAVGVAAAGLGSGATGTVMAQADDTDNVGDVGTPSNPVDVFGDGITANSISADRPVFTASPGEVQSQIDDANAAGGGTVILDAEATYDPASTWVVKGGVKLDYNGAVVDLSSDIDVHHIHPDGQVWSPNVITANVSYTSRVYRFRTSYAGSYGPSHLTRVHNGFVDGTIGEGRAIEIQDDAEVGAVNIEVETAINGIGSSCVIFQDFANGYVNSCTLGGYWRGAGGNFIQLTGSAGNVSGNQFYGLWQPVSSSNRGLHVNHPNANYNLARVANWDEANFNTGLFVIDDGQDFNGVECLLSLEYGQVVDNRTSGGFYYYEQTGGKGGYHHNDATAVENRTLFYDTSTSPATLKYKRSDGTTATIA